MPTIDPVFRSLPIPQKWSLDLIKGFIYARAAVFTSQYLSLPLFQLLLTGKTEFDPKEFRDNYKYALGELTHLLQKDAQNIQDGIYPIDVLEPENPFRFFTRYPRILWDGVKVSRRRRQKLAKEFPRQSSVYFDEVPDYYLRNFHFQSGGYLTNESAELYDHQVEILFSGAADAMRRLLLKPWKQSFARDRGKGLHFLEIGCGTGRLTRFMKLTFPEARITALDLSRPYLERAQAQLSGFKGLDFLQGNGSDLPFKDQQFDGVYSCFLFHELPIEEREKIFTESQRVLKPQGWIGLIDSIQKGDRPQLDFALERFPTQFHEPFYRNYTLNPLEGLVRKAGFTQIHSEIGFLSKVVWAQKSL